MEKNYVYLMYQSDYIFRESSFQIPKDNVISMFSTDFHFFPLQQSKSVSNYNGQLSLPWFFFSELSFSLILL